MILLPNCYLLRKFPYFAVSDPLNLGELRVESSKSYSESVISDFIYLSPLIKKNPYPPFWPR